MKRWYVAIETWNSRTYIQYVGGGRRVAERLARLAGKRLGRYNTARADFVWVDDIRARKSFRQLHGADCTEVDDILVCAETLPGYEPFYGG